MAPKNKNWPPEKLDRISLAATNEHEFKILTKIRQVAKKENLSFNKVVLNRLAKIWKIKPETEAA